METRKIRKEEKVLTRHLLEIAGKEADKYDISEEVNEYKGDILGSINFTLTDSSGYYVRDIIRVAFGDEDEKRMEISLTENREKELLDLDFWKENLSKLIRYPKPEQVTIIVRG